MKMVLSPRDRAARARFSAVAALLVGAGMLAGCVVYPDGGGYYGHDRYDDHPYHDHDHGYWRD